MVKVDQLTQDIINLFKATPVFIVDVDRIIQVNRWILAEPRDSDGKTYIGSMNMWSALKLIANQTNTDFHHQKNLDILVKICDNLCSLNILKESPEWKRDSFKLISNEEFNAKREERGPYYRSSDDQ